MRLKQAPLKCYYRCYGFGAFQYSTFPLWFEMWWMFLPMTQSYFIFAKRTMFFVPYSLWTLLPPTCIPCTIMGKTIFIKINHSSMTLNTEWMSYLPSKLKRIFQIIENWHTTESLITETLTHILHMGKLTTLQRLKKVKFYF